MVISNILKNIEIYTTIKKEYLHLIAVSILIIAVMKILRFISHKIYQKQDINSRKKYRYNKQGEVVLNILTVILLFLLWMDYLKNFLTLITFISTAITLSLKDLVFNFFSGIYIRSSKIFAVEDRIEINGIKGDVVNINKTGFDLLELGERVNGEQSTGRIIHVPNSLVFTYPVKNYVKAFKYVWDEMKISIPLDADVYRVKKELYKIINKNSTVRNIPDKMEDEVSHSSADYRIYFNNLEPIIYAEVVEEHIELCMRFLVHPKKQRTIENSIWLDIIKANNEGLIQLYKKV